MPETRLEAFEAYMRKWKEKGLPTARYRCPSCKRTIERSAPSRPGDRWSSAAECPCCGADHLVAVHAGGKVDVRRMPR